MDAVIWPVLIEYHTNRKISCHSLHSLAKYFLVFLCLGEQGTLYKAGNTLEVTGSVYN